MTALVDAHKAELAALLDLAMYDIVVRQDVDVARVREARGSDLVGNDLAAQPIAIVVGVPRIHHDGEILLYQLEYVFNSAVFPSVVAGGTESSGYGAGALGEVLVSANGGLNGWRVEISYVKRVWEGIRLQLADIVLVSVGIDVVKVFDFFVAEIVCCAADLVDTAGVAVFDLVHAVARTVEIGVHLGFGGGVERSIVVRYRRRISIFPSSLFMVRRTVARVDSKVVVGLVLNQWIIPPIANQNRRQANLVGARYVQGVLRLDILVENRAIMTAVALCSEIKIVPRVLREGPHESLQCLPEIGCSGGGGVGCERLIWV